MATRSSIKNKAKAKLGAIASLAAGGVALSVDAGASDPIDAGSNALLESAFKLLEEGQNQWLAADESQTPEQLKLQVNVAGASA